MPEQLITPKRILIDQDGVLADFNAGFTIAWQFAYPDRPVIPPEQRTKFYIRDQYPPEYKSDVVALYTAPGFVRNLPPIDGALQALKEMQEAGHIIRICTSPLSVYQNCVEEKYAWVEQHLGLAWVKNVILAKDKTEIRGDYLIDDRPEVTGDLEPTWKHILFDQLYNRKVTNRKRLLNWSQWREVIS